MKHARVIWKRGTSVEKITTPDWPVVHLGRGGRGLMVDVGGHSFTVDGVNPGLLVLCSKKAG